MYLYRFEAKGKGFPPVSVIMLADSDEKAFSYAQAQIEKDYLGGIIIEDFVMIQKKRVSPGEGYTVEKNDDSPT